MNTLLDLIDRYVSHANSSNNVSNAVYSYRMELLRAMNELTLSSYGKVRQQVRAVKDTRSAIDR